VLAGGSTTNKDSDINWADAFASGNPFGAIPAYAAEPGAVKNSLPIDSPSDTAIAVKFMIAQLLAVWATTNEAETILHPATLIIISKSLYNIQQTIIKWIATSLYGTDTDQALIALYFINLALQMTVLAAAFKVYNSTASAILLKYAGPFVLVAVPWIESLARSRLRYAPSFYNR
jgi:hypothetical protein